MIKFDCPLCGETMEAPESLRGEPLPCPACGDLVKVAGINPVIENTRIKNKNKYRQHPVYEKQHWILFSIIVISVILGIWATLHYSSWEYKNKDQILQITREISEQYESDNLNETVYKYLELKDFIGDRRINDPILYTQIETSEQLYERASNKISTQKRAKLKAQAQLNYKLEEMAQRSALIEDKDNNMSRETFSTIQNANKEYSIEN